jgi:predicted transcriptional regulator
MLGAGAERGSPPRRREVTDLYATVLEVVKRYHGAARVTRVSYGAGMPVDRLRTFVERLLALGLLRSEEFDGRPVYDITPRGQEFLDTYWKMRGYVETLGQPTNGAAPGRRRARGASTSTKQDYP